MLALRRLSVVLALGIAGRARLSAQTALAIYNDGRVVVRRSLPTPLVKGRNTLTLEVDGIDPASVFSPDTSVSVVLAVLYSPTDRPGALAAAVGETLSFVRGANDTVRASVVRVSPPEYRLADGRFLMVEPGEPLIPAALVRTVPELALTLEASRPRPRTELVYLTTGVTWSATYQVLLQGGSAAVSGTATVLAQTLRAASAEVELVAGTVGRARQAVPMFAGLAARAAVPEASDVSEEAVGEVHVYTLSGRLAVQPGVAAATALFPRLTVPVTEQLIVPGALPYRGYLPNSMGAEPNRVPVEVWYTLQRPRGTPFGDRPLPGGVVQVYQADSAGRPALVGEARSDHTPAGRDLRVQSGDAFDVTAERVLIDYVQETIPPVRRGLPATQRITASFRVTLTNAKPTPVTVDVRETRAGTWQVVTSTLPAEKLSATEVRFAVPVAASGQAILTYTVQVES